MDWLLFAIACVILFAAVVFFYRRDRAAERRHTRDAINPDLREEVEAERRAATLRREKFQQALKGAEKGDDD